MIFGGGKNKELDKIAELLVKGITALFRERGELEFSSPPKQEKKTIIEYEGKMRADGMEKFNNEPTYVSAVNYYTNEADMQKGKALGALVIYVEQAYLPKLMKLLQYPPVDDENEDAMLDSCGTLSNIIAGRFKSEMSSAGYIELEMSHFQTYRNSAFAGVAFCRNEFDMYEVTFDIAGKKRLVMEISMGVVPKR